MNNTGQHDALARRLAPSLMVMMLFGCAADRDEEAALRASEGAASAAVETDPGASVQSDAGTRVDAAAPVDAGGWSPPPNWLSQPVEGSPIVVVKGNGCGNVGTASLTPDGESLTIVFDAFEATLRPGFRFAHTPCNLAIVMRSAEDYTYAVTAVHAQGYARLASGQSARVVLKHYSAGIPILNNDLRADVSGPYDGPVVLEDTIPVENRVWAPCGRDRQLTVNTSVDVRGDSQKDGFASLAPSASNPDAKLTVTLAFRSCRRPPPPQAYDAGVTGSPR